jgi:hypothetical protein
MEFREFPCRKVFSGNRLDPTEYRLLMGQGRPGTANIQNVIVLLQFSNFKMYPSMSGATATLKTRTSIISEQSIVILTNIYIYQLPNLLTLIPPSLPSLNSPRPFFSRLRVTDPVLRADQISSAVSVHSNSKSSKYYQTNRRPLSVSARSGMEISKLRLPRNRLLSKSAHWKEGLGTFEFKTVSTIE